MKQTTTTFSGSFGAQPVTYWTPDAGTKNQPLLLCADGWGEIGKTTFAGGSIGDQLSKGATLPAVVINVHKPNDGDGSFQGQRFIDVQAWAVKAFPDLDLSRLVVTGLSLSGGAIYWLMANAFAKKVSAFIPVCGTKDISWQQLINGVKTYPTPFRAYGSSVDDNPQTRDAFTQYKLVADNIGFDADQVLYKNGSFVDTKTGHVGVWPIAYGIGKSDVFDWAFKQSRPELIATPVVELDPVVSVENYAMQVTTRKVSGKTVTIKAV